MVVVRLERACGCFKKSDLEKVTQFDTLDEALKKANEMCLLMNENFCSKHKFKSEYIDGEVIIKMQMNV